MSKLHNKKRNVGIIYEQIISFMCKNLLENKKDNSDKALKIIKKYFKEGTQIKKEYKLFKALIETNNVSSPLATSIISEAKKACNYHFDNDLLEKEKSFLIKDLNHTFGKGTIFSENIKNYKKYATIQTLLNEWRSNNSNFDKLTEYEIKLHESLTTKEVISNNNQIKSFNKIHYKMMNKLFENKYYPSLNDKQKRLIEMFVNEEEQMLIKNFSLIKENTSLKIKDYCLSCDNQILKEKYNDVLRKIDRLSESDTTKENIKRYLTVLKLNEEITGDE